jgi:hypothetical protein
MYLPTLELVRCMTPRTHAQLSCTRSRVQHTHARAPTRTDACSALSVPAERRARPRPAGQRGPSVRRIVGPRIQRQRASPAVAVGKRRRIFPSAVSGRCRRGAAPAQRSRRLRSRAAGRCVRDGRRSADGVHRRRSADGAAPSAVPKSGGPARTRRVEYADDRKFGAGGSVGCAADDRARGASARTARRCDRRRDGAAGRYRRWRRWVRGRGWGRRRTDAASGAWRRDGPMDSRAARGRGEGSGDGREYPRCCCAPRIRR